MKRASVISAVSLVFALGLLFGPTQQAFSAPSNEKTVTLQVQGML